MYIFYATTGSYDHSPSDYLRDFIVDTKGTNISNADSEWHIINGGKALPSAHGDDN